VTEPAKTAEARLELEIHSEVPAGTLITGDGEVRGFRGWIELAAVIEDWRRACGAGEWQLREGV
jgi:hypothetical protein